MKLHPQVMLVRQYWFGCYYHFGKNPFRNRPYEQSRYHFSYCFPNNDHQYTISRPEQRYTYAKN